MECLDLNNLCRTCKSESPEMKSLYYRDAERGLDEMLMALASVQINNDDELPKLICRPCYVLLKNAYVFKEQCEKVDMFLREYLENLKKANLNAETVAPDFADLVYTPNFLDDNTPELTDVSQDRNLFEEINNDPKIHMDQVIERDMHSVKVFDDFITIFECKTCSKGFFTLQELQLHEIIHSEKTFRCKQCDKTYTTSQNLLEHELSHTKTKAWMCKICNKMLTKLDLLKKHLITHLTDTRYVCSKCGMKFNCAQYLQDHFIQCKGEKVYVCDVCNKVFNRLDSMEVHRKTHQDKFPALPTLENLDNILEYCTEIDYDENTMFTDVLEEGEKDDYFNVMEGTIGSEVQFLENQYQLKIDETGQVTTNDIYVEKDVFEVILKKAKSNEVTYQENIDVEAGNNNNYNKFEPTETETYRDAHQNKPVVLSALENLGNISEYYMEIDYDDKTMFTDRPVGEVGLEAINITEGIAKVGLSENLNLGQTDEIAQILNEICIGENPSETLLKKANSKEEIFKQSETVDIDVDNNCNNVDSRDETYSEGLPMKRPSRNTKKSKGKQRNKYLLSSKKRSKGRTAKHKVKSDLKRNSENLHDRVDSSKTFSCKQCGKSYTRLQDLSRHELSHRRNKVYVCKICDKTLRRSEHLKEHLMTHVIEKPFTCSKCCRGFNRAQQHENHVARCNGEKIYICDICSKVFHREDSMEVHRMMHPDKLPILPTLEKLGNISEYYMEICKDEETMFTDASEEEEEANDFNVTEGVVESKLELSENQDQEIIDETPITSNQVLLDILESDKSDEEINDESENADVMVEIGNNFNFDNNTPAECLPVEQSMREEKSSRGRSRKCPVSYNFSETSSKRSPLEQKPSKSQKNKPLECPECNIVFKAVTALEEHAKQQHDGLKLFQCTTCNNKFRKLNSLKEHELTHLETTGLECEICGRRFLKRHNMLKHMELHDKSDGHACDICKAVFSKAEILTRHQARKHDMGETTAATNKKYECKHCTKVFSTEKMRDSHMKSHLIQKTYQCNTCEKTFNFKSNLLEHMKFHNDSSKNFLCAECGKRFIRKDYLEIHMMRHRGEKPFVCKYCSKSFHRSSDLTLHERYHTGEKSHLCAICGKAFVRSYTLKLHMRTHTGEKPYRCTQCDAAFAQGNDLKIHIRRHTGEKFKCDLCPRTYLVQYALTFHKQVTHGMENVSSKPKRSNPESGIKINTVMIEGLQDSNQIEPEEFEIICEDSSTTNVYTNAFTLIEEIQDTNTS